MPAQSEDTGREAEIHVPEHVCLVTSWKTEVGWSRDLTRDAEVRSRDMNRISAVFQTGRSGATESCEDCSHCVIYSNVCMILS